MIAVETKVGSSERREREKRELREKILDAARDLFGAHGFEAVTMRAIAEKIEYSPTAIYIHFKDKNALIRELCAQDFGALSKRMAGLERISDPIERLRRVGQSYAEFALELPNHYRVMFMTPGLPPASAMEAKQQNPEEDAYLIVLGLASQAIKAGLLRPELKSEHLVAQVMWSGIHGIVSLQIAKRADDWVAWTSIKLRIKTMIDVMIRGMVL